MERRNNIFLPLCCRRRHRRNRRRRRYLLDAISAALLPSENIHPWALEQGRKTQALISGAMYQTSMTTCVVPRKRGECKMRTSPVQYELNAANT